MWRVIVAPDHCHGEGPQHDVSAGPANVLDQASVVSARDPLTIGKTEVMLLNPTVTGQPVTPPQALSVLAGIRSDARAGFLVDDSSLAEASVDTTGLGGHKQVTDWHLLNLAARHDGVLVTFDRRFAQAVLPCEATRLLTLG